jgi:hypothetical protein
MAAGKQLAIGDPVLWYGFDLAVVAIEERNGVRLAEVADVAGLERREAIKAQIAELRAKQAGLHGAEHAKAAEEIKALDERARAAIVRARLRADLLSWWEERGVWVSEGRILTTAQIEAFERITGSKPKPDAQRQALVMLEAVEGA